MIEGFFFFFGNSLKNIQVISRCMKAEALFQVFLLHIKALDLKTIDCINTDAVILLSFLSK